MTMWSLLIFFVFAAWLVRWVSANAASRGNAELNPQHTAELVRLREEVDQLAAQLLRMQDEQSFMMRLLTEGGAATQPALPAAEAPGPTTNPESS